MLLTGSDWFVYALVDEEDVEVYIGITNNPVARLKQHRMQPSENLRELMEQGYEPVMRVLRRYERRADARGCEKRLIRAWRPLLNVEGMPPVDTDEDCGEMVRRILSSLAKPQ